MGKHLVCNFISFTTTFTTEAYQEILKIQKSPLNCDTKKVLYLLKCKTFGEAPYFWNTKTKFCYRLNNYNSKYRVFRKGNQKILQKCFHAHYWFNGHSGIDDWKLVIFEQCEIHKQLKERETFWYTSLKPFTQ